MDFFEAAKSVTALVCRNKSRLSRFMRVAVCAIVASWVADAQGAVVTLHPSMDNSIYSERDASNALGGLFVGRTLTGNLRRALLEFDLAASEIPAGVIINQVSMSLTQTKIGPAGIALFELHPLLAAWGEGTSSGTGSGGNPTVDDVTWNYRLFDSSEWLTPGGDFGPTSGTATFGSANEVYTFDSTAGLVADVQGWLDSPGSNFGWLIQAANESGNTSARELGSREGFAPPALTISYTAVPEPGTAALLGAGVLLATVRRPRTRKAVGPAGR